MTALLPRFARDRVMVTESDCWEWTGSRTHDGYGRWGDHLAHRRVYELLVGPLPAWSAKATSRELDHLCRNRACVNPAHLELVTRRENALRGISLTADNLRRTHCPQGHELTGSNLVASRLPHRQCRACHLEHQRRWRESRRASAQAS